MDKKKRRCLYGAEKKPNSIQPVENISLVEEEEPPVKKNKNGHKNIKIEEKIIKDHSTDEKSESKSKSVEKSIENKIIEKIKEESIEDIKVEIPNPKSQAKTKQRYKSIHTIYFFFISVPFNLYFNYKKFVSA